MKKTLLLTPLLISSISFSQTQPTVHNGTFDNIAKSSDTCACAGWINKDIADQGETSTTSSSAVIRLDNLESDGIYQEIAVETNSNYTLNLSYIFSVASPTTTTTNLEVYILKGSAYETGYTPAYALPDNAAEKDLGYRSVADVEITANQLVKSLFVAPTHKSASIASISFDTGTETSIAIFIRAVGPYDANSHGDSTKDKGWMNGDSEVRIDNLTLVNNGLTVSYTPIQPTVHNGTFDNIAKSSDTCACAGWINKDIADQGETSTTSSSPVIKLDNLESDGIYQEIPVETNSNYTLNLSYIFSVASPTTTNLEVYILKGSAYETGYTPAYALPDSAAEKDLGYQSVADVETTANQLVKSLFAAPTHKSASIASISFDTGTETSIAIFIRAVGPYNANSHGDSTKDKGWMNGDSEVRIDNLTLVNNGYSNNSWLGTSTAWNSTGNWSLASPPNEFNKVIVENKTNQPIIGATTGAKAYNLYVDSDAGATLNITSGGSLIVEDSSLGNITYNVAIADTNWHLVSSPVVGEEYDNNWVSANSIASGEVNPNNRGISTYDNGTPDATTEHWRYMQVNESGTFNSGKGYSMLRTATGNYRFTGTYPTTDVSPIITQNHQKDNLLGNPYPSYLNIDDFITANTNNITSTHQAVYVWNGVAYTSLTNGYIHPGQAFFINSNVANQNATITEAMQSHQTGVTFYRSNHPSIKLTLSNGTSSKETQINYLEGKTIGLDPRFDVGLFRGVSSSLDVFTQLIEGYESIPFERQALPNVDLESMVVPVGVKAVANEKLTFSLEAIQLPANMMVFLEDRLTNTFTRLDKTNTKYLVTLTENINGVGRFYIHTSKNTLSIDNSAISNSVSVYKSGISTLRIIGLPQGDTTISVFDIQGKKIVSTSLQATSLEDISLPKLSAGIYIVDVQTEKGTFSKKIIL